MTTRSTQPIRSGISALLASFTAAAVLSVSAPPPAHAQRDERSAEERDDGDSAEYLARIHDGLAEFDRGNYLEARALLEAAHRIQPNARTLRALGIVEFELRHYVRARSLFGEALADQRKPLTDEMRAEVQSALERTERFIGRVEVRAAPASALITLDGRALKHSGPTTVLLDPGEHTIVVSSAGYASASRRFDVAGGDRYEWTAALAPSAAPVPARARNAVSLGSQGTAHDAATEDDGGLLSEWWFWGLAVGVVGGGITAALLLTSGEEPAEPVLGNGEPFRL